MNEIRAVLFDLDNTLVDFIGMKQASCKAAAQAMVLAGLQMEETEAYERLVTTYFSVGIESDRAFSEFLKNERQFDHKILAAAINAYLDAKTKWLKPYPNVKPVLETLERRGLFLSVVTDAPKTKAYQRLLNMGIESFFRFVVGFEDTDNLKSTGLPLLLALDMLRKEMPDLANCQVLMVGDSVERDIVPAQKLGLQTALSRYGQIVYVDGTPDYELEDITDLVEIL